MDGRVGCAVGVNMLLAQIVGEVGSEVEWIAIQEINKRLIYYLAV